ncbi:hypothetical protein [Hyphococcus sp.]|nr:MAG: hypothetical protein DHS20C04_17730 [Marinicaulis sp.]
MTQTLRRYDSRRWTGEPDKIAAIALAIALAIGVIGFLTIGVMTLQ